MPRAQLPGAMARGWAGPQRALMGCTWGTWAGPQRALMGSRRHPRGLSDDPSMGPMTITPSEGPNDHDHEASEGTNDHDHVASEGTNDHGHVA